VDSKAEYSVLSSTRSQKIRKLCKKIAPNLALIFGPNFFRGQRPEFLDLHYKIQLHIDSVAKFHGDRPTEL